jgi:hypothetical protein
VTAEWGYGKTEAPSGAESLPRKRGGTGDYKGAALISSKTTLVYSIYRFKFYLRIYGLNYKL